MNRSLLTGAALVLVAKPLLHKAVLTKLQEDVRRLNEGDHSRLLAMYAEDAVLHFAPGAHRWAGEWVGKAAIERFLDEFVAAGVVGEIQDLWLGGPLHRLVLIVRFDDHVTTADGERLYENRTTLVIRTRWGKIVDHTDFYLSTEPIQLLEERLQARGRVPVAA